MAIIYLTYAYLISGLIFSIPFLSSWIKAVDESAHESSWAFKLIILPGCIIFWPVLLRKYFIAKRNN
ncbi:MAG TPA: hypothetical protein VK666_10880 [Chryseolinea sp.]|nr:hypothetical protein [Chryseolinea sp.]